MPGTQRAHWPSVRLRQEFVHPARRWWPSTEPSMGSLAAFTAVLGAQASEGTGTGVSDCVLGGTVRDLLGFEIHLAPPGSPRVLA